MDKIFERGKMEQDSMLCEIQTEILQAILKFLPGFDIMHLSHTCKELYQKLPFCLVKRGEFLSEIWKMQITQDHGLRDQLLIYPSVK